ISFSFTDQNGNNFGQRNFVLDGNQLTAKFLNEAPFSAPRFAGTFSFDATAPVAAVALRTFVNERGEFLFVPQTIASIPDPFSTGTVVMGQFAAGAGWRTRVNLGYQRCCRYRGMASPYRRSSFEHSRQAWRSGPTWK